MTVPLQRPADGRPSLALAATAAALAVLCVVGAVLASPGPARASVPWLAPAGASAAPAGQHHGADAWAVWDVRAGCWLDRHDADVRRPVASLTKMLAALVVSGEDLDEVVVVPELEIGRDESQVGLRAGDLVTRRQLLAATLVASGNDAVRTLAVDLAGDEAGFLAAMEAEAAALGLRDTRVVDVAGLDAPGQHSTARDVVTMARAVLVDPVLAPLVDDATVTVDGRTFPTTNDLVGHYPGAVGVKTGTTRGAGPSVVAAAVRGGRTVVVAVLGADDDAGRFAAAAALLDEAFAAPASCRA